MMHARHALIFALFLLLPNAASAGTVTSLATLADLKALGPAAAANPAVQTQGYWRPGVGGGSYLWDAASTATDCLHVAVGGSATGRYVLQPQSGQLLPTQCGAWFDSSADGSQGHDDAAAWNVTEIAAAHYGLVIGPVAGISRVTKTITPGVGVIHQGAGIDVETIQCHDARASAACFYLQNPKTLAEIEAPKFYDMTLKGNAGLIMIQYNSIGGGFGDDAISQGYMMRPIVQRVKTDYSAIGLQCSKCMDGDFSQNTILGSVGVGIDLEGSDWMGVGDAGANRVADSGSYPIKAAFHGYFGNGDRIEHNDLLLPRSPAQAYIWSSARSSMIRDNFMEGNTHGACEIQIAEGTLTTSVVNNQVTDNTVKNWLCVEPAIESGTFTGNNTTNVGQGQALFGGGRGAFIFYNNAPLRQMIVHNANWSEGGFPFNTEGGPVAFGPKVVADFTPSSPVQFEDSDYGGDARSDRSSYVIPPSAAGNKLNFTNIQPVAGNFDICVRANTNVRGTTLKIIAKDGGAVIATTSVSPPAEPMAGWSCIAPVTASRAISVTVSNDDVAHKGDIMLYELTVSAR